MVGASCCGFCAAGGSRGTSSVPICNSAPGRVWSPGSCMPSCCLAAVLPIEGFTVPCPRHRAAEVLRNTSAALNSCALKKGYETRARFERTTSGAFLYSSSALPPELPCLVCPSFRTVNEATIVRVGYFPRQQVRHYQDRGLAVLLSLDAYLLLGRRPFSLCKYTQPLGR
jgi:hypothetical protein